MKKFMDDNFLLQTRTAEYLYHEHAKKMPIIDYHCHLVPGAIGDNIQYRNITQAWLYGDHYKWRAMRSNGVDEKFCTGNASDYEKFEKWAETVPMTIRNPLYHWTHLELRRYFNIEELLGPKTAKRIYDETSSLLNTPEYSVRNLMKKMNVRVVCTTDDPVDSLEYHKKIKDDGFEISVYPTWRPDKALAVENIELFNVYLDKLAVVSNTEIITFNDLIEALKKRQDYFNELGCRLSDHGLENFYADDYTEAEINDIFHKVRIHHPISQSDIIKFKSAMLYELALMDYEKGWTQQFHIGAMRNNNTRKFGTLGPDTGFDSIGDYLVAQPMSKFLDRLDSTNQLTKTILYNLNPADNYILGAMLGNFQDGPIPGKIQLGSGWWFLDQKYGMEDQINTLSTLGLLSRFIGMLTDSRSLLSYPRHEYFRRILCNLLGNDIENGEIPSDMNLIGKMVEDICYNNAREYFRFSIV
ncbi:MAG: glucuronate isomerase [Bacteroidales bacterium]|nr:glucuronate isomerase [Bacteroidales bacterium]